MLTLPRWLQHPLSLTLAVALYWLAACNTPFWRAVWQATSGNVEATSSLAVVVFALFVVIGHLLLWPKVGRPLLALLVLVAAPIAYFSNRYGVVIDADMIRNVVQTDQREAGELMTPSLLFFIGVAGVLPALLVLRWPLQFDRGWKTLREKVLVIIACLALAAVAAFSQYAALASLVRNHKPVRYLINPANVLYAVPRFLAGDRLTRPAEVAPWGRDAKMVLPGAADGRKRLMVLVVGETARAQNFGLNGYTRDTTPELAKLPVTTFTDVRSCGTETAVSVPCLFSGFKRSDFSVAKASERENLLDVVSHAGARVLWLDNQAGSKGVAARVGETKVQKGEGCTEDGCMDIALVDALKQSLADTPRDTLVVLHMMGNHGPAYYLRHPADRTPYTPECRDNELQNCSREAIINAYDNDIRYTDYVLSQLIKTLSIDTRYDTRMLYVSDHGESTGENGIYLHGTPYFMAPDEQTHVPLLMWWSDSARGKMDPRCLAERAQAPASHDNVFHTVLGEMGIATSAYQSQLDLTANCRR
ncbi:phosphoethanolamine transferase [Chitinibacteraceae bacterium HSL-7]